MALRRRPTDCVALLAVLLIHLGIPRADADPSDQLRRDPVSLDSLHQ